MPKHTKFTNNPLTGQVEKTITEAMSSITISGPKSSSSLPSVDSSRTNSALNSSRGGRGLRRTRSIHHRQSSLTDHSSFNRHRGDGRMNEDQMMIDDDQARPSCNKRRVSSSQTNMSLAENEFSSALFSKKVGLKENFVMSPFSIYIAFLTCMVGTNNESLNEIIDGLFLRRSFDSVDQELTSLKEKFGKWKDTELENYTVMIKTLILSSDTLSIANRIYLEETVKIHESFLQDLEHKFDSNAERVDFKNNPSAQVRLINRWVESKTNKYIKNLLSNSNIDSSTVMILVNAIYFNGKWKHQFQKRLTTQKEFRTLEKPNGNGSQCDMMTMKSDKKFCYAQIDDYELLQLPYNNEEYCMTFIKPQEHVEINEQTENDFNEWISEKLRDINQLQPNTFVKLDKIEIPKFKFELAVPGLIDLFRSSPFNIQKIFNDQSDFSNMLANNSDNVLIGAIVHKAFIQLDESGTIAAAATAIGGRGGGRVMQRFVKSYQFIADRPFSFVLQHLPSNTILFTGKINKTD